MVIRFAGINGAENLVFHGVRRVALNEAEQEEMQLYELTSLLLPNYSLETEQEIDI